MPAAPATVSITEAARRLGVRRERAVRWLHAAGAVRQIGSSPRVVVAVLDAALAAAPAPSVPAPAPRPAPGTAAQGEREGGAMKRPAPIHIGPIGPNYLTATAEPRPDKPPRNRDELWLWRLRFKSGGVAHVLGLGRMHVRDVYSAALARLAEIGEAPRMAQLAPAAPTAPVVLTVADLMRQWAAWMATRPDISPTTQVKAGQTARVWAASPIAAARVDTLTTDALRRHLAARQRQGCSTGGRDIHCLRSAMRWAVDQGIGGVSRVPASPVGKHQPRRSATAPDLATVRRVAAALDGWQRDLLLLMLATGARISEVCALDAEQVNLAANPPTIEVLRETKHGGLGKTGDRLVPLAPDGEVVDVLRRLVAEAPSRGGRLLPVAYLTAKVHFAEALRGLPWAEWGVRPMVPRDLRALMVDRLIDGGVHPAVAAGITGHSVQVMLATYATVKQRQREAAMAALLPVNLTADGVVVEMKGRKA